MSHPPPPPPAPMPMYGMPPHMAGPVPMNGPMPMGNGIPSGAMPPPYESRGQNGKSQGARGSGNKDSHSKATTSVKPFPTTMTYWLLERKPKALLKPGQDVSWEFSTSSKIGLPDPDIEKIYAKYRAKCERDGRNISHDLKALTQHFRRKAIDDLLRREQERDPHPQAEWTIAALMLSKRPIHWGSRHEETTAMRVILSRCHNPALPAKPKPTAATTKDGVNRATSGAKAPKPPVKKRDYDNDDDDDDALSSDDDVVHVRPFPSMGAGQFHPQSMPPQMQGPPAFGGQGMPPQGMPPMGRPPQNMPLSQGMPPQGMPPQGMPPQGMPPQGMPPHQGMPPQGMPPHQGMPPQGMPSHQGMPPQGMPPHQGMPPQGRPPSRGMPPQGMPPHNMPGMPPHQGMPPQGMPPQGMPPQGRPPSRGMPPHQGMPPHEGMPPQGMPPQGMPPQGMPPQGMPPQGMPPNNMPPQGMPSHNMPPQGRPPSRGMPPHEGMPPHQGMPPQGMHQGTRPNTPSYLQEPINPFIPAPYLDVPIREARATDDRPSARRAGPNAVHMNREQTPVRRHSRGRYRSGDGATSSSSSDDETFSMEGDYDSRRGRTHHKSKSRRFEGAPFVPKSSEVHKKSKRSRERSLERVARKLLSERMSPSIDRKHIKDVKRKVADWQHRYPDTTSTDSAYGSGNSVFSQPGETASTAPSSFEDIPRIPSLQRRMSERARPMVSSMRPTYKIQHRPPAMLPAPSPPRHRPQTYYMPRDEYGIEDYPPVDDYPPGDHYRGRPVAGEPRPRALSPVFRRGHVGELPFDRLSLHDRAPRSEHRHRDAASEYGRDRRDRAKEAIEYLVDQTRRNRSIERLQNRRAYEDEHVRSGRYGVAGRYSRH
ncbi:hypothetical protein EJ05DRAFT_9725 [Pseudovirgaria hyperparasitica]|uniref:Uncharacterized protein n=1 Tax=Pseudovirgaria hyperparasitica TaxID=470096 RepID=A0A6A6WKK1_9PEZI|nr:uncharacterized protein EJ05DRAFT_9725 [Pseudovirgaria hyperparasitica]KAF2762692.1 hypothetical protein EJ05DRAFT_9725 [Pseudovirgaria hyperparasitica]